LSIKPVSPYTAVDNGAAVGNQVAYIDQHNGSLDVFVSTFSLPPVE
jgi:hypothetical protein